MARRQATVLARARKAYGEPLRLVPAPAPVTSRCGFCGFEAVGPVEEAREAFRAHVCGRPRPTSR